MIPSMLQKKRFFRLNQTLTIVLVLAICVGLVLFAKKYSRQFDITQTKQFTLSPQTLAVLKQLAAPVTVTGFFQKDAPERQKFKDLMASYQSATPKWSFKEVDPDQNPSLVKEYGIRAYGTLYFESGTAHAQTTTVSEESVTNTVIGLTQDKKKRIAVLSGHGEKSIIDTAEHGFSLAAEELTKANYDVSDLSLLTEGKIPDDVAVLVLMSPTSALLPTEQSLIESYLKKEGARALLLLDPPALEPDPMSAAAAIFAVYSTGAVIIDPVSRLFGGDYAVPIVSEYPPHPITTGFKTTTFFPIAQTLTADMDQEESPWEIAPIARTQASAWGEKGALKGEVKYDEATDLKGPLTLAYAISSKPKPAAPDATSTPKPTRIVVVGDSDFASNAYYDFSGNSDFFKNIIHWLSSEEDLIAVHPKEKTRGELQFTPAQGKWLFLASVIALPLLFGTLAIRAWLRRRKQ